MSISAIISGILGGAAAAQGQQDQAKSSLADALEKKISANSGQPTNALDALAYWQSLSQGVRQGVPSVGNFTGGNI